MVSTMRWSIRALLSFCLLAMPAFAQTPQAEKQPANASDKSKDRDPQPVQQGQQAQAPAQPPKDNSLSNYDVNGSNASDAMGGAP
jgi:hypothetical protein